MPYMKSITKEIRKYIITIPVSGSKKVRILGINVITITVKNITKSFLKVLLGYLISKYENTLVFVNINANFMNSLGWKDPIPGIVNQHLEPFISVPKIKSKKSSMLPTI